MVNCGLLRLSILGMAIGSVVLAAAASGGEAIGAGFTLKEKEGEHVDVLFQGKVVGRYMYAYDTSSPERRDQTCKPYLHVFDAEGKAPITNGPGGRYPHHRGIFIGWSRVTLGSARFDLWHTKETAQVHQKFLAKEATADRALLTSLVSWNDREGKPLIVEERAIVFRSSSPSAFSKEWSTAEASRREAPHRVSRLLAGLKISTWALPSAPRERR